MSCYVTLKTQLHDKELLRQTLQCMGCVVREGAQVGLLAGGRRADLAVQTPAGPLGFVQSGDGPMQVVGIEEVLRSRACTQFLGQVTQQYARRKVLAEAERGGYRLVEETVDADNTIRLVVRRW